MSKKINTLVLSRSYLPVRITTVERAFHQLCRERAEVVVDSNLVPLYHPNEFLRSPKKDYPAPSIIRLTSSYEPEYKQVAYTRSNLFIRDGYTCQYCGDTKYLTIDHVNPTSKGGANGWRNTITCCFTCNSLKGDKTLDEMIEMYPDDIEKWTLSYDPYIPSMAERFSKMSGSQIPDQWKPFIWK